MTGNTDSNGGNGSPKSGKIRNRFLAWESWYLMK